MFFFCCIHNKTDASNCSSSDQIYSDSANDGLIKSVTERCLKTQIQKNDGLFCSQDETGAKTCQENLTLKKESRLYNKKFSVLYIAQKAE